ncbi:MAG: polyphosphate kinase 2 [Pseudomonadota bacterium]
MGGKPHPQVVDGFDLEDPDLPEGFEECAFRSGDYPYDKRLKRKDYEEALRDLQVELVKLQDWVRTTGERIVLLFEGRDAAGKGGTIHAFKEYMNPRHARVIALTKPTETERGQWYFQRYVEHLPTKGEIVMFDRSWYNRAGVEPVMGFCSNEERDAFLAEAPRFEDVIVDNGIRFFKFWLNVGREMQLKRFHDRRHSPLKRWKLSPIDLRALGKWDDYTAARDLMIARTHSVHAPWTIVRSNDKRRARLNAVRHVLSNIEYDGKDHDVIGDIDPKILGGGTAFLKADLE